VTVDAQTLQENTHLLAAKSSKNHQQMATSWRPINNKDPALKSSLLTLLCGQNRQQQ
jgi:hypothetical protein